MSTCCYCEWWGNEGETAACYRLLSTGSLVHLEWSNAVSPPTFVKGLMLVTHGDFGCVQFEPKKSRLLEGTK
jgi:hypothetical protein